MPRCHHTERYVFRPHLRILWGMPTRRGLRCHIMGYTCSTQWLDKATLMLHRFPKITLNTRSNLLAGRAGPKILLGFFAGGMGTTDSIRLYRLGQNGCLIQIRRHMPHKPRQSFARVLGTAPCLCRRIYSSTSRDVRLLHSSIHQITVQRRQQITK